MNFGGLGSAFGGMGRGSSSQGFDYYVDSVAGNDGNSGRSEAAPFQTMAALSAVLADGHRVALKRGSTWTEQLGTLSAAKTNVTIEAYGTGKMPILDGRDIVSGSWTKTATRTFVYDKVVTITTDTGQFVSVWEDDVRLRWVASQALCDATAGTYYVATTGSGGTAQIYVHATGDGDPGSNGKVYKHSRRAYGLITGTNWRVSDIHTKCSLHNDGSLILNSNSIAYRCLAEDGTKHNMFLADGAWAYDCIAWKSDWHDRTNATAFVAYTTDGRGKSAGFVRCVAVVETDKVGIAVAAAGALGGFYAHTSSASLKWSKISYIDCSVDSATTGLSVTNCDEAEITRPLARNVLTGISQGAGTGTVLDAWLDNPPAATIGMTSGVVVQASTATTIEGLRAYVSRAMAFGAIYAPATCTLTVRKNALQRASGQAGYCFFQALNGASSIIQSTRNIIYGPSTGNAEKAIWVASSATLNVDYNVYYKTGMDFEAGGVASTDFAAYRTANPSLDANSVSGSDPLFNDAANGDFSLQEGSPAIALGAGLERPTISYTAIPSDATIAAM